MASKIPDEVLVAKLSIEAARIALESLFERMQSQPRSSKVIVTDTVHEACLRLSAAQDLLMQLAPALDAPLEAESDDVSEPVTPLVKGD